MNDLLDKEITHEPLKLADRCDQCGESSQAFVKAIKEFDGKQYDMLLCGHHYREHEPKLVAEGWYIQDERDNINQKPMSGSNYQEE